MSEMFSHLGPGPMGYLMAVSGSGSLLGSLGLLSVAAPICASDS